MPGDETFDVGVDTRTPVDDKDYQVPFPFTGKIDKLTFKLGPEQLAEADRKVMQKRLAIAATRRARRINSSPGSPPRGAAPMLGSALRSVSLE